MQIIVYSTSTCPYCKMLKDYLNEKQILYTEKLVDQNEAAKEEMGQTSNGFLGVPFISITKDDETHENVIGFDKGKLDSILGIQQ
jgi:glutaredoxin 3